MKKNVYIHPKDINPLLSIRRDATSPKQLASVDSGGFLYSGANDG